MECPRCKSDVPEVSHFCHHCGTDLLSGDAGRSKAYAARPDEPVASFRLVSTIMPYGTGDRPYTYRIALGIAVVMTVLAAALGALPIAIMVAAFAIPIVYILYLYDVNLWEDEPVPVVAIAFVADRRARGPVHAAVEGHSRAVARRTGGHCRWASRCATC